MADIISGATFFAPADLGDSLTENGVLVAGQSFNGSYGGEYAGFPVAISDKGSYASSDKVVIVNTQLTALDPLVDATLNVVVDNAFVNKGTVAIIGSTISGSDLDFTGNTVTKNGELVGKYNDKGEFQYWTHHQVEGGIIYNYSGKLYFDNVTVTGNTMRDDDPDSSNTRGLLYSSGTMTVKNSYFSDNHTKTGSGYLIWNGSGNLNVSGSTFENNLGSGSAMYINTVGNTFTDTLFRNNLGAAKKADGTWNITASGSVFNGQSKAKLTLDGCTFTGNTAGGGAAAYFAYNTAGVVANDSCFYNNLAVASDGGGAFYLRSTGSEFTNCYFEGNTGGNGGAIRIYHLNHDREVTLTGCTFKENRATGNGGVVYTSGGSYLTVVNFTDCKFLTASDTIYANNGTKQVVFNFAGNNTVNGKISGHGIVNVADDTKFTFDNDSEISINGLTFAGGATMNFTGSKKVTFAADQLLTGITVTINGSDYTEAGVYTVAENAGNLSKENITFTPSASPWLSQSYDYAGTTLTLTVTDKTVAVMNGGNLTDRLVVGSGKTGIFNDIVASGFSKTDGASANKESYGLVCKITGDATVKIYGGTFSNNTLLGDRAGNLWNYNGGSLTIDRTENGKGTLFTQNVCSGIGSSIYNQSDSSVATVTGATFSYNRSGGATVYSNGVITITESLFDHNLGLGQDNKYRDGAALGIYSGTANLSNVEFTGNTAHYGGAIYAGGGTLTLSNVNIHENVSNSNGGGIHCRGNITVTNSQFKKNIGSNGGAFYLYHGSAALTAAISATTFTGNTGSNGGAIYAAANMTITIDGCVFDSNTAISNGGAICNNGNMTVINSEFKTATDTIHNAAAGTLTFGGNITLNASLLGDGTYTVADGANFTIGKGVDLNGVDFTQATITVDGADYLTDTLIATGVGGADTTKLNVTNNKFMTLTLDGTELWLKESAGTAITENIFTGNGTTNMGSGNVETFFATKSAQSDIATKISGGKVESNLVGGAYVSAGNNATVNSVELLIGGTAELADGSRAYAGGYLYGNENADKAAAEAQLTVGKVNVNLTGGTVGGNLYGGAHVRQNGNASVTEVNITVTAGSHSRIYAGGWAEKGAKSYVTTSNVTISGGLVDYLYGAGANADGHTYVGTTNITVSDAAVVNTIFMGGRYGYSEVDKVNLTFDGAAKVLKRLSGVSSAGMDYSDATVVELETNVTADLIDYVDKFVIKEGCMLTANDAFYLGNRLENGETAGVTTFDFIAEGEANWTAVAGISDFANAKFAVNGIEGSEWIDDVMAIGDYTLTRSDADKDGKYIIAITK